MVNQFVRFMQEEEGATAIEYGLMAALIAAVIVAPCSSEVVSGNHSQRRLCGKTWSNELNCCSQ